MEVIVIGGSAAGLKAACRISRLQPDVKVTVIVKERHFGYSTCGMAYFLSGDVDSHTDLLSTQAGTLKDTKYYQAVKGVTVLNELEAVSIDRVGRLVHCKDVHNGANKSFPYDKLIIATGTKPLAPSIPKINGEDSLFFHTLEDAIKLRRNLEKGKIGDVTIIGGGFIGVELCEAFTAMWGVETRLIELQPHILSRILNTEMSKLVESEFIEQGIELRLGRSCRQINRKGEGFEIVDDKGELFKTDRVLFATGVKPNTSLASQAGIEIGRTEGIKVNHRLQTSDPDIYSAGDCVEMKGAVDGKTGNWSFGSIANRMGRIAGDNVCNGSSSFGPVLGSTVIKFFDFAIASVGLTNVQCLENGYEVGTVWSTFFDKPWYFPESKKLNMLVIYDRKSLQILGAQIISQGEILTYVDRAAHIIQAGWTMDKLCEIEHAYSPPYSQPFDPFHTIGFIDANIRSSGVKIISPNEINNIPKETVILDVRLNEEIEAVPVNFGDLKTVRIPIEELRERLSEIPKKKSIVTLCEMGSRAWDAALILRRAGWQDVGFLGGGALFQPKNKIQ